MDVLDQALIEDFRGCSRPLFSRLRLSSGSRRPSSSSAASYPCLVYAARSSEGVAASGPHAREEGPGEAVPPLQIPGSVSGDAVPERHDCPDRLVRWFLSRTQAAAVAASGSLPWATAHTLRRSGSLRRGAVRRPTLLVRPRGTRRQPVAGPRPSARRTGRREAAPLGVARRCR